MTEEKLVLKNTKKMNAGDSDIYRSIPLAPKSPKSLAPCTMYYVLCTIPIPLT